MLVVAAILSVTVFDHVESFPSRIRRQYPWNASPYFEGSSYWDQQQWNSGYTQNYNNGQRYQQAQYQQPYGYQNTWQYSQYNSPSYGLQESQAAQSQDSYVTGPPVYQPQSGGYGRPKYLATMEPKPTLPVVLERSNVFATDSPITTSRPTVSTTDVRHPTFLERVLGTPLPAITDGAEAATISSSIDSFFEKDEESGIPARPKTGGEIDKISTASEEDTSILNKAVPKILLIDGPDGKTTAESGEVAESGSTPLAETTELPTSPATEALLPMMTTVMATESTVSEVSNTQETRMESTQLVTTTTELSTTTEEMTTSSELSTTSTQAPTTSTQETTTSTESPTTSTEVTTTTEDKRAQSTTTTKEPVPITLIATQEVDRDYDLNKLATSDVSPTDSNFDSDEEGSGSGSSEVDETNTNSTGVIDKSTFTDGIIGLRPPPLPKVVNNGNGIEVVRWSDSDKKLLL